MDTGFALGVGEDIQSNSLKRFLLNFKQKIFRMVNHKNLRDLLKP